MDTWPATTNFRTPRERFVMEHLVTKATETNNCNMKDASTLSEACFPYVPVY